MDLDRVRSCDGKELVQMLQNLMVTIEQHSLHPIPLDDLIYPCSHCHDYLPLIDPSTSPTSSSNTLDEESVTSLALPPCACQCQQSSGGGMMVVETKDTGMQTTGGLFEVVGVIPHIDSDEEEQGKRILAAGTDGLSDAVMSSEDPHWSSADITTAMELPIPTRISDIPEKLLMSGINLPGTHDVNGRPIILFFAECVNRSGLNKYEIARLLLYYNTIPDRDELRDGFTILLLAESDQDNNVLELIDKAAILMTNHFNLARILIWKPGVNPKYKSLSSRVQAVTMSDPITLSHYIHPSQTSSIISESHFASPAATISPCAPTPPSSNHQTTPIQHDQLEWVEFYRQLEPFQAECRRVGRGLLTHLAHIRLLEDASCPGSGNVEVEKGMGNWTRGMVAYQCRQQQLFSSTPLYHSLTALRASGPTTLTALSERAQWLQGSAHVQRALTTVTETYAMTDRIAQRLQQLEMERRERLRELRRLKVMHEEAVELQAWFNNCGELLLKENLLNLRIAFDSSSVKDIENTFETFYFEAMRHIEKSNDLTDECINLRDFKAYNFKDTTESLKTTVKSFTDRLEYLRENIENAARCFQLLADCESLESNRANEEDFDKIFCELALKSGNDKLIQISNHPQNRDKSSPHYTSTPIKQPAAARRRSVSSQAFIFKCNHRADGVTCTCKDTEEDDLETTVSYQLKRQFLQMDQKKTSAAVDCNSRLSKSSDKSGANKDGRCALERKVSATLDGIKEVRESVENLLLEGDVAAMCDSGVSTEENSVGDDKVAGCCSCDSSVGEDRENFEKSDDIDDHFDSHKVPPIPSNSHLYYHPAIDSDSTDGFDSTATDAKTQKTLLYIMREMIQTERDYVASLDYIIVNYIPELTREDIPQALRGQRNAVFGNVEKIYEFHSQYFLRELEQYELCPLQVGQIFLKYQSHFALYALYNKNKPKSDSLMSEFGSKFFKSKQLQISDLMDLASYLLKPVQRMGKYALLLQQMLKACPKLFPPTSTTTTTTSSDNSTAVSEESQRQHQIEASEEFIKDIRDAEEMVRFQLRHGNDLLAMDSIRECDVNLKEQGALIRQNEFMVVEGRAGKKTMRQVFLFEELILFSKARRLPDRTNLDLFIYKSSIKTSDIGLTAKIGDSSTRFEIWFRKRKPNDTFILQASSEDVKKAWTEELSQLLWKQAITNKEVRQQEMSSMGIGNKPCLEIRPSVNQISDRSISYDQLSRTAPRFRNSISVPSASSCVDNLTNHMSHSTTSSSTSSTTSSNGSSRTCSQQRATSVPTTPNVIAAPNNHPMVLLRPHSVISVSSSTGSAGSSSGSSSNCSAGGGKMALSDVGSPKGCGTTTRSGTLNSQCSIESGIIADISHDDCSESVHWSMEKSPHSMNEDLSNDTTTEL